MDELRQHGYNKRGQNMMPFIAVIFLAMSLIVTAGQHFSAQENGGRNAMNRPVGTLNKDVPQIDIKIPSRVKTATFALG